MFGTIVHEKMHATVPWRPLLSESKTILHLMCCKNKSIGLANRVDVAISHA